jgi:hypothetical protein
MTSVNRWNHTTTASSLPISSRILLGDNVAILFCQSQYVLHRATLFKNSGGLG